jgi:hypothetical protein
MDFRDGVVDADTHISEPGDLWTSRLPPKLRERVPRPKRFAASNVAKLHRVAPPDRAWTPQ